MNRLSLSLLVALLCAPGAATAGGLDLDAATARAIARAGAVTVSDSNPTALAHNPAGIARRSVRRVQLGTTVHDQDIGYTADAASPRIESRAAPVTTPVAGFAQGWDRLVLAVAYIESGDRASVTDEPAFNRPAPQVQEFFPHRYAGTRLRATRRTVAAGFALRATPWLAVGATATAARVEVAEARAVWSGFGGIDPVGDPSRDLRLSLDGADAFVPGAVAGVLVVPETLPVEFALAASWSADAQLDGTARLEATRAVDSPRITRGESAASATLALPLVLRAGARYAGDLIAVEIGADLTRHTSEDAKSPTWQLGLQIEDRPTLPAVEFTEAPSVIALRDHVGVHAAVDLAVVRDFAWLTGGYAYRGAGASTTRINGAYADLGGHTVAVGAEGYWNDVTITLGFARTLTRSQTVASDLTLINPTGGGTMPVGSGTYRTATDSFGISVEMAWDDLLPLD